MPYKSEAIALVSFMRVNLSAMYFTPFYLCTNASYHRSNVDYYCINESREQNNAIWNSAIPCITVGCSYSYCSALAISAHLL